MSTAPQSNQNAGAGEHSCRWCRAWNAAFAALQLQPMQYRGNSSQDREVMWDCNTLREASKNLILSLLDRDTDCPGCQRSAEIHLGDTLGDERRKWRAEMWRDNPSMRFMMRQGSTETFQEDAK